MQSARESKTASTAVLPQVAGPLQQSLAIRCGRGKAELSRGGLPLTLWQIERKSASGPPRKFQSAMSAAGPGHGPAHVEEFLAPLLLDGGGVVPLELVE